MPRIRKKTSKRTRTNDRKKREVKVREGKKKKRKGAQKNPQWKSKTPKDPGIPNDFPFKEQILAEVAEQRRVAAEEKQRRKDEKRAALKALKNPEAHTEDSGTEEAAPEAHEEEEEEGSVEPTSKKKSLDVGSEAIASLAAKAMTGKPFTREQVAALGALDDEDHDADDDDEVPALVNRDLPTLSSVLDVADAVVMVLDARDPMSHRSAHLEEIAQGTTEKKVLFILSKIDLCPREALVAWTAFLRTQHPTLLFRCATACLPASSEKTDKVKAKGKAPTKRKADRRFSGAFGDKAVLELLAEWAKEMKGEKPMTVAVVGVVNVGKSSFINTLLGQSTLPIYTLASSSQSSTTTELPHEVTLDASGTRIRFIDTPGLSWIRGADANGGAWDSDQRAKDILLRSRGRIDRFKDPILPVTHIVERANNEDLMLMYNLPAFTKGDVTAFLSGVARANQLVKKRGEPDLTTAARLVLRDWSTGKFARYTVPSHTSTDAGANTTAPSAAPAPAILLPDLYARADEEALVVAPMRKDLRRGGGVVRLVTGDMESRRADLDGVWKALNTDHDDGHDVADGDDDDEQEEQLEEVMDLAMEKGGEDEDGDEDMEEEEEEEEDDSEEEMPLPTMAPKCHKQKRKRAPDASEPPPASKKVAFDLPSSSRETRKAQKSLTSAPPKSSSVPHKKPLHAPKSVSARTQAAKAHTKFAKPAKVANAGRTNGGDGSQKGGAQAYDFGRFF